MLEERTTCERESQMAMAQATSNQAQLRTEMAAMLQKVKVQHWVQIISCTGIVEVLYVTDE